jgi:alpha-mannosidase
MLCANGMKATIDEAMDRAKQQAQGLRVVRGEWADWWAHGHSSTAYEVGLSRLARAELRAAEVSRTLANLNGGAKTQLQLYDLPIVNWYRVSNLPLSRFDWPTRVNGVYDNLLLFAEHTWGPFETVSHPHSVFTRVHWHLKANFAYQAVAEAHNLSREALTDLAAALPPADEPAAVIINPLSVTRSELVTVRTPGINHTVLVRDIPPLGVKVIPWDAKQVDALVDLEPIRFIENDYYRLTMDSEAGTITSLIDKASGKEWIDPAAIGGLGAVVYEDTNVVDKHPSVAVHRSHFHPSTPGPHFNHTLAAGTGTLKVQRSHYGKIITLHAHHAFLPFIQTEIILHDAFKAIDINVTMDKLDNYAMEGVYVLFPFALDPASFWMETANAVYQADAEQVPRSCRDWYSIQHGIGVTDGSHSVLWATREAPLVQLSDFHTGQWLTELGPTRGHIYSWLMNNLYFTNFKAAQGGRMAFSYRLTTREGGIERADVRAFGEAFGHPPVGRVARVQPGEYEWLRIEPETVQVQVMKPAFADDDSFVLRLKETAGQPTQARIIWKNPVAVHLMQVDLLELKTGASLKQEGDAFIIDMDAHALTTIQGHKL